MTTPMTASAYKRAARRRSRGHVKASGWLKAHPDGRPHANLPVCKCGGRAPFVVEAWRRAARTNWRQASAVPNGRELNQVGAAPSDWSVQPTKVAAAACLHKWARSGRSQEPAEAAGALSRKVKFSVRRRRSALGSLAVAAH
jgi:hypothetical protein